VLHPDSLVDRHFIKGVKHLIGVFKVGTEIIAGRFHPVYTGITDTNYFTDVEVITVDKGQWGIIAE